MMNSPASGSDTQSGFYRLAEPVRRWIWQQQWTGLRNVQEQSIPAILAGGDVVISARTAAGKTEAAFLPLMTRILEARGTQTEGFSILYISPLKALINDQFRRLESLCEDCEIPLHRWHGDVSADAKKRARERPYGIVLITPESLEATLVRRGREAHRLFHALEAIVVDELHAFIGSERGRQLQSILTRIEVAAGRDRIDRIGLSATLGDMGLAAEALRPRSGEKVKQVVGNDPGGELHLQIRGYELAKADDTTKAAVSDAEKLDPTLEHFAHESAQDKERDPVTGDLFRLLRGHTNLLFAGSRKKVESYADGLRALCEEEHVPNEFFPHHGNLSRFEREDVETRLRDNPLPTTAVATTTLELGVDIGDVDTVAQIGPGPSVASIRQRLGRSGRRPGKPAILRVFAIEPSVTPGDYPALRLRLGLIQSVAMIKLLVSGWCEPPSPAGLHLSTLIHQILATILQVGGIKPAGVWTLLCERGPFSTVEKSVFIDLLRAMAAPDVALIEQSPDGLMMIGKAGEKIAESYEFYAVFVTPDEYRIIHGNRVLGTYPVDNTLAPGQAIIFAGRRWRILDLDDKARVIIVASTKTAVEPDFSGDAGLIHDKIVHTMREVLLSDEVPAYLDRAAAKLLANARETFEELGLASKSILPFGDGVIVFPWIGTKRLQTLALAFMSRNFVASSRWHTIEIDKCRVDAVSSILADMAQGPPPEPYTLVNKIAKPYVAKFDYYLPEDLIDLVSIVERLDIASVPAVAASILTR